MKTLIILLFCILYAFCSCKKINEENSQFVYNILIEYDSVMFTGPDVWTHYDKNNSYLFIEEGFNNDLITVMKNNLCIYKKRVTSIIDGGPSDIINLGKESDIKNISVRINNGNLLFTEVNSDYPNFYCLLYLKSKKLLNLILLRTPPLYD